MVGVIGACIVTNQNRFDLLCKPTRDAVKHFAESFFCVICNDKNSDFHNLAILLGLLLWPIKSYVATTCAKVKDCA